MVEDAVSKARATVRFLNRKVEEYGSLRREISVLKRQVQDNVWRPQRRDPIHSPEHTD
jgi:hypothetical protein